MNFIVTHRKKILWGAIALYAILFSLISAFKYYFYQYNLIDLAIFNQVFFNSLTGNFFDLSIHPPTYLGDHFNPIIFVLLAPYWFLNLFFSGLNQPIALLIMQSIWLSLGAWPVYLIAKNIFEKSQLKENTKKILPLACALAYLFNPFIQNINLYEFHLLPLAIPLLLFAFYFYQKRKFLPFLFLLIIGLAVREDVSLIVFMFGVLAFMERKKIGSECKKWIAWPMALGAIYFLLATQIISYFNAGNSYKYTIYYSWITENGLLGFLGHFTSVFNIEMLLGFLMPFVFLPLLKPRYLILALPALAQILLGAPGGSSLILRTHYSALFLPALFIASLYGLNELLNNQQRFAKAKNVFTFACKFLNKERMLLAILLIIAIIYNALALGPGFKAAKLLAKNKIYREKKQTADYLLKQIPENTSVAAGYSFLAPLSSRRELAAMHYVFMGKQEFGFNDYPLPPKTQYILLDLNDFLDYQIQMPTSLLYHDFYSKGDDNLRTILKDFGLKEVAGDLALFEKDYKSTNKLYLVKQNDSEALALGWVFAPEAHPPLEEKPSLTQVQHTTFNNLWKLSLNFTGQKFEEDYQVSVKILDGKKTLQEYLLPIAWGLYPTSEWQENELIQSNYWLTLPEGTQEENLKIEATLIKFKGGIELNGFRSGERIVDEIELIQ